MVAVGPVAVPPLPPEPVPPEFVSEPLSSPLPLHAASTVASIASRPHRIVLAVIVAPVLRRHPRPLRSRFELQKCHAQNRDGSPAKVFNSAHGLVTGPGAA